MNTPLLTWLLVISAVTIMAIIRVASRLNRSLRPGHRLIESGKESEEFFAPGDPLSIDNPDCDYDYDL